MDAIKMQTLISDRKMRKLIESLIGQRCCRKQIGYRRSLSVGFGEKVPNHNPKTHGNYYGEWEIGAYESAWRIMQNGEIICASHDASSSLTPEDPPDIDKAFREINFGRLLSIRKRNEFDFEIKFDSGISIDLFGASSNADDGDFFHIFCPNKRVILFKAGVGWFVGPSDKPWSL
jgi:hypothetical protein